MAHISYDIYLCVCESMEQNLLSVEFVYLHKNCVTADVPEKNAHLVNKSLFSTLS